MHAVVVGRVRAGVRSRFRERPGDPDAEDADDGDADPARERRRGRGLRAPGARLSEAGFGNRNPLIVGKPRIGLLTATNVSSKFCPLPAWAICDSGRRVGTAFRRLRRKVKKRKVKASVCSGDSGGPLVAYTPAGPRLIGIAEASTAPPSKRNPFFFVICGLKGYPSIHTRTSLYGDFIQGAVAAERAPRLLDSARVVDTHAHLGLCEPAEAELIASARAAGVKRILTVGLDEDSNPGAVGLRGGERRASSPSVGRHPNSAAGFDEEAAEAIEELCDRPGVVAVGETGLDFFRDRSDPEDQRRAFSAQIAHRGRTGKALVIHLRDRDGSEDAVSEAFDTLAREADGVEVILHCFSAQAHAGRSAPPSEAGTARSPAT